jgi:hypothetical protein
MTETCTNAEKFLSELVEDLGLQLKVSAENEKERAAGYGTFRR